jgi:parvulin-like peptidyl-prolyl isomerase
MQLPIPPPAPQVPRDKVVLTVGDLTLTAGQFDDIIGGFPENVRAFYRGPGRKTFADQLAKMFALAEEGKRRKLDQTPAYKAQLDMMSENVLASALANSINTDLKIDDATVHAYYEAHKNEFELTRARHILIRFKGSQVPLKPGSQDLSDEEALAKANKLEARLKAGEDFTKLASAESDEPQADVKGGDLGEFPHGTMVPTFEEAAAKLKPGETSEPVRTQFGYHIIRLEARRTKPFEEVRGEIERKLKPQEAQKAMEAIQSGAKVVYDPVFFQLETK